ncbi:hypothetical protein B0T17DRAFT_531346 [Bombardia bombarda]|uniref:Uncharacterized protein n=1 Tax=Bombardia bombarda TaxID=252184 RepID=A0AA39X074_9PEZI|nr:hypothetical protein B0T17DRAFT_531346 [Bombardia bombarda]
MTLPIQDPNSYCRAFPQSRCIQCVPINCQAFCSSVKMLHKKMTQPQPQFLQRPERVTKLKCY